MSFRSLFPGHYKPSVSEFKKLWSECIFVFDANALLFNFRVSERTSKNCFEILDKIKSRLWIPYQVAEEYHRNRHRVIEDQVKEFEYVRNKIEELVALVEKHRDGTGHFIIKANQLLEKIRIPLQDAMQLSQDWAKNYENPLEENSVSKKLDALFGDSVGDPYSEEEHKAKGKLAKERLEKKIPPGFKDTDKETDDLRIGDVILWFQILDKAKASKKSVIFVTDDRKGDWWLKSKKGGEILAPLPELIKEFVKETKQHFYMYRVTRFFETAGTELDVKVNEEAKVEMERVEEKIRTSTDFGINLTYGPPVSALNTVFSSGTPSLFTVPTNVLGAAASLGANTGLAYTFNPTGGYVFDSNSLNFVPLTSGSPIVYTAASKWVGNTELPNSMTTGWAPVTFTIGTGGSSIPTSASPQLLHDKAGQIPITRDEHNKKDEK